MMLSHAALHLLVMWPQRRSCCHHEGRRTLPAQHRAEVLGSGINAALLLQHRMRALRWLQLVCPPGAYGHGHNIEGDLRFQKTVGLQW